MATKTIRTVRRVEKPRPLKTSDSFVKLQPVTNEINIQPSEKSPVKGRTCENLLENLKCLHVSISNGNLNEGTFSLIGIVCSQLKDAGMYLETHAKDQLDKYFVTLRNASRDERIAIHIRMRLLEIIELRAMGWKTNDNISSYYEHRNVHAEDQQSPLYIMRNAAVPNSLMSSMSTSAIATSLYAPPTNAPLMTSASQASLGPGEIIKNSGKYTGPTKVPGKNFYKDEVVIRNSDSGKVSPGARDRLVQITGPHGDNISKAKVLIEDTIRRNASPIRDTPELCSVGGLLTSGSCTSLNSSASEESLHNQPSSLPYQASKHFVQHVPNVMPQSPVSMQPCQPSQVTGQPQQVTKKNPLTHSFSMGNNTLGEYSYTISVGPSCIRVSGFDADVVSIAKLVLEEYFAGQAEHLHNQSSTVSGLNSLLNSQRKHPRVQKQATQESENGGNLSNGHIGNSSSEEDTFKAEGSPPAQVTDLPLDSPYHLQSNSLSFGEQSVQLTKAEQVTQVENFSNLNRNPATVIRHSVFPASKSEEMKKTEGSSEMLKRRREMFVRSSSQREFSNQEKPIERQSSLDGQRTNSNQPLYSYTFLLDCAASRKCRVLPQGLKNVDPDVACIIVQENPTVYFDPAAYRALASTRRNFTTTLRNPNSGPEEVWDVE